VLGPRHQLQPPPQPRERGQPGDTIRVGDLSGQIVIIDTDATVIRTTDGRVRVPNHMLLESVVTIYGEAPPNKTT
jgi:small-conductance mechanosensitive channel